MDFELSPKAKDYVKRTKAFIAEYIEPMEADFWADVNAKQNHGDWTKWEVPAIVGELKAKAKAAGLWNMFLPDDKLGAGLSIMEYASVAEETGRSILAPMIFNCNAPDTGNMEVLWRYGSEEQKAQWLTPLLEGDIRSVFCMTEPDVASSDATNMAATAVVDGDQVILNGTKWWSSGIGDPHCKIGIFMASTPDEIKQNRSSGRHQRRIRKTY